MKNKIIIGCETVSEMQFISRDNTSVWMDHCLKGQERHREFLWPLSLEIVEKAATLPEFSPTVSCQKLSREWRQRSNDHLCHEVQFYNKVYSFFVAEYEKEGKLVCVGRLFLLQRCFQDMLTQHCP